MAITNGYCTLAELKAAVRITDSIDDTLLENAIEAASRRIDGACNRRFYADGSASARVYIASNSNQVMVDDIYTLTGLVVQVDTDDNGTYDATRTIGTDFSTLPLNCIAKNEPITTLNALDYTWPISSVSRPLVQVTARWGWAAVPDAIREATVLLASRQFKRYDSPLGVAGFGDLGTIMVRRVDPDVEAMIAPYKIIAIV
jgi:hypothetical protein